jgi:hypothetical protein
LLQWICQLLKENGKIAENIHPSTCPHHHNSLILIKIERNLSMPDPRLQKLAEVLVNYSVELKPGQQLSLRTSPIGEPLAIAVFAEAIKAGAHVFSQIALPGATVFLNSLLTNN